MPEQQDDKAITAPTQDNSQQDLPIDIVYKLSELRQTLEELTMAHNGALRNPSERVTTYEALLKTGGEAIVSAKSPEEAREIEQIILRLPWHISEPSELHHSMLQYFVSSDARKILSEDETREEVTEKDFDEQEFGDRCLIFCATVFTHKRATSIFKMEKARTPYARREAEIVHLHEIILDIDEDYGAMIAYVISLPPLLQIRALEILDETFATVEPPLQSGPVALRAAGKRSSLEFRNSTRKAQDRLIKQALTI